MKNLLTLDLTRPYTIQRSHLTDSMKHAVDLKVHQSLFTIQTLESQNWTGIVKKLRWQ